MNEKISIIIPVYKAERYLSRCLDSIINQTYTSLEIILIDDGSPDKSGEICDEYGRRDSRIRVVHQENKGVSAARNKGLEIAQGEFIGFVDADDYLLPEMYERMLNCFTEERDLIICGSNTCDGDGKMYETNVKPIVSYEKKCPEKALLSVLYQNVTMAVWSKLFRRKRMVSEAGQIEIQFNEQLSSYEDFIFICEYIYRCQGTIYLLPERLYNYCYQRESLSHKEKTYGEIAESLSAVVELQDKYDDEKFNIAELFFIDTAWKYWVVQILKRIEYKKLRDFAEHAEIKQNIFKYKDAYYKSEHVQMYKKIIVYMLLTHEKILFAITKFVRSLYKVRRV